MTAISEQQGQSDAARRKTGSDQRPTAAIKFSSANLLSSEEIAQLRDESFETILIGLLLLFCAFVDYRLVNSPHWWVHASCIFLGVSVCFGVVKFMKLVRSLRYLLTGFIVCAGPASLLWWLLSD